MMSNPLFLAPVDVTIFRQEFGTMFRQSHRATFHANDIQILFPIDKHQVLCDETGVAFVARDVTDQLLKWTTSVSRRRTSTSPHVRSYRRH